MNRVEREIRWFVRAWPVPDRFDRGEEIVGTTLDLVPKECRWLPIGIALSLVTGGLKARWKTRPPLWRWALYRISGQLPLRWHRWMVNDLLGPGWRRRLVVARILLALAVAYLGTLAGQFVFLLTDSSKHSQFSFSPVAMIGFVTLGMGSATLVHARRFRKQILARHGYFEPNDYRLQAPANRMGRA